MDTTSASSTKRSPWFLAAISRVFGIHFAPVNVPLERRLQTFAVLFWMCTFLFMGSGYLILLTYLFFYTHYWWVTVAYITWFLGDRSISHRGGRRWHWVRNWKLWKHYRDFFPMKVVKTAELDPSKNYIMGYHPHGILSAGAFALFATEGLDFSKLFPGITPYLLTLEAQFLLPFYREFLLTFGTMSASHEGMNYLLGGEDTGNALCLVIGGAKEALDCHPGTVTLFLKKRLGFCKMALRHGASLVPIFGFGENDIYDQVPNPEGSLTRKIQNCLQRLTGWAPCVFFGRGVFQYSFGFIPFRKPVTVVVGKPIDVEQVRDPSEEEVKVLHTKYVNALTKLYNDHKEAYSRYPDRSLLIN